MSNNQEELERARLDFEREKWRADSGFRQEEIDLKRSELGRSRWINPLVIAVLAAAAAAAGNAGIALINSFEQLRLERERAETTFKLERSKSEAARVLEVVKVNDPDKAAVNLRFLVDTGLIQDAATRKYLQVYLETRKPGEGVVLPGIEKSVSISPSQYGKLSCVFVPSDDSMSHDVKTALVNVLSAPPLSLEVVSDGPSQTELQASPRKSPFLDGFVDKTRVILQFDGNSGATGLFRTTIAKSGATEPANFADLSAAQRTVYSDATLEAINEPIASLIGPNSGCVFSN